MNMTEPIKEIKDLELLKGYLRGKDKRYYLLLMVGISSALRISDILSLKIEHIWDGKKPKSFIRVNEKKTGKFKQFPITQNLSKAIKEYMKEYPEKKAGDYLFTSRVGDNKPFTRQFAVMLLNEAVDFCGINVIFGTHGMRKTWAYHSYRMTGNLEMVSLALNHRSLSETRRYICLQQEELDDFYLSVNL
jgi:integrase